MELISVIVPIYNSAMYLQECIKSVLEQSYTCFELILVDDGSKDNSIDLCRKLCKADSRVRIFSQEHCGASVARNVGMNEANGKYLFFLDSDDVIHCKLLETLYKLSKENDAVIAAEQYLYIKSEYIQEQIDQNESRMEYTLLDYKTALECFTSGTPDKWAQTLYGIGGKLILRDAVGNLLFDERLSNGEDSKFMYRLLSRKASVVILRQNWYYYRQHQWNTSQCSVKSCENMYRCQKYMIAREYRSGRIKGAVSLEAFLLLRMVERYREGRKMNKEDLLQYLKALSEKERKMKIFSRVGFRERLSFILAFDYNPLYQVIHRLYADKK